jgi:Sulfotransferase domain
VVASMADAHQGGGWMGVRAKRQGRAQRHDGRHNAEADPASFVRARTQRVVKEFEQATLAYDVHRGPKTLVRYEDIRVDTVDELTRICRELELEADPDEIERVVTEHSWEQVPDEEKGSGKFHRKASPGSWKDDLDPEQVRIIERLATPILDAYYEGWRDAPGDAGRVRRAFARQNKT